MCDRVAPYVSFFFFFLSLSRLESGASCAQASVNRQTVCIESSIASPLIILCVLYSFPFSLSLSLSLSLFLLFVDRNGLKSETMPRQLMESSIHPSIVVVMAVHMAKHAPSPPLVNLSICLSVCLSACFRRRRRKRNGTSGAHSDRTIRICTTPLVDDARSISSLFLHLGSVFADSAFFYR